MASRCFGRKSQLSGMAFDDWKNAKNVKVSVTETEKECMMILINSASELRNGTVTLNRAYQEIQVVYGAGEATVAGQNVKFTLPADKSAVFRLK